MQPSGPKWRALPTKKSRSEVMVYTGEQLHKHRGIWNRWTQVRVNDDTANDQHGSRVNCNTAYV